MSYEKDELRELAQMKNGKELLFGITTEKKVINNTDSPDEAFGMAAFLASDIINMIIGYQEALEKEGIETEEYDYRELRDKFIQVLDTYNLVKSGFTSEEALDIIGLDADVQEINNNNNKEEAS